MLIQAQLNLKRRIEINGQIYDLNLLENLIGKKCTNSVFLEWESVNGNGDSIFTKEEVTDLKTSLYDKLTIIV